VLLRASDLGGRREEPNMAISGTIARLVADRGFGFIRDERGQELFFHATSVEGASFEELHEGQSVEFEREPDTRGRGDRAAHVRPQPA
jgi:CspA family cold shock protein